MNTQLPPNVALVVLNWKGPDDTFARLDLLAAQVIAVMDDTDLHDHVSKGGYNFIKGHYSVPVVQHLLEAAIGCQPAAGRNSATPAPNATHTAA